MRAAVLAEYGNEPDVVEVDRPELPDDSAMVEVRAAAINPIDWIVMDGDLKDMLPHDLPRIVGSDVSDAVAEIGSASEAARFDSIQKSPIPLRPSAAPADLSRDQTPRRSEAPVEPGVG